MKCLNALLCLIAVGLFFYQSSLRRKRTEVKRDLHELRIHSSLRVESSQPLSVNSLNAPIRPEVVQRVKEQLFPRGAEVDSSSWRGLAMKSLRTLEFVETLSADEFRQLMSEISLADNLGPETGTEITTYQLIGLAAELDPEFTYELVKDAGPGLKRYAKLNSFSQQLKVDPAVAERWLTESESISNRTKNSMSIALADHLLGTNPEKALTLLEVNSSNVSHILSKHHWGLLDSQTIDSILSVVEKDRSTSTRQKLWKALSKSSE